MTTFWHITVDRAQRNFDADALVTIARRIDGSLDSTTRIVLRRRDDVAFYEPFVDGGAFASVYAASKAKHAKIEAHLRALALAAMETGGRVGFLRSRPPAELPPPPEAMERVAVETALAHARRGTLGWWELDLGRVVFLVSRARARFWTSVPIAGNGEAAGFFGAYRVVAESCEQMRAVLREHVAEDGAFVEDIPPPEVLGPAADEEVSCERQGGRVLYPKDVDR